MKFLNKIGFMFMMWLLSLTTLHGQTSDVLNAGGFYADKNLDSAKYYIDRAIKNSAAIEDPYTWQLRGYIYKDLYKNIQKDDRNSPYRYEALDALKKSIVLDSKERTFLDDNVKGMKYLLSTMHNDVSESLDPIDYAKAIELFRKEQEYYKIIDPSQQAYADREIAFGLSLGSVYNTIIESSKDSAEKSKFINLAISVFSKVLSMDQNNISANYNMGILYYNQAVNLIKNKDYDTDLLLLDKVQDQSTRLLKSSLPFMTKAYTLDPKREDALEGLSGIYFGLNEYDTSNIYRQRLQEVKKNKNNKK